MNAPGDRKTPAPRVLMAIPSSGSDGKDRLIGIFRYLSEGRFWDVILPSSHLEFTAKQLGEIISGGIDGAIISAHFDAAMAKILSKAGIPTVLMHDSWIHRSESGENFRFAITNHVQVGRIAARHFLSLGRFAAYAFLGDTERNRWGLARRKGYELALAAHGKTCSVFTPTSSPLRLLSRERFCKWMSSRPKPLALFAASDRMAVQAITFCHGLGLRIPDDVAVLGVDNDETLVLSCEPRLSSIAPDFPSAGYAAAKMLDDMMSGLRVAKVRLFGVRELVERASTSFLPPSVKLVEDALAFIASCDLKDLSPESVARHLRASRPLLDLRFRELKRGTVASAIRTRRLDEVTRLLRETDFTIRRIGAICGFANERSLKNIFRHAFGIPMTDYRRSSGS